MLNFMEIKPKEPKLKQKHVVQELGVSESTIKMYSKDFHMNSTYKRNGQKKRSNTKTQQKIIEARKVKRMTQKVALLWINKVKKPTILK